METDFKIFNIKIKYFALWLGFIITSILGACYWVFNEQANLNTLLNIVLVGLAGSTLVYAAKRVNNIYLTGLAQLNLEKKKISAKLLDEWHDGNTIMKFASTSVRISHKLQGKSAQEFRKYFSENQEKQIEWNSLFNYFEKVANMIDHDLADEPLLKDYFKEIFISEWNKYVGYINYLRQQSNQNSIFAKLETLVTRWINT